MNIYEETKFLMKKYNISANKDLGQNFLIDDNVIENIVEAAEINEKDCVIEIGPGLGTLTSRLVEKAGKVIAIELDKKMLQILNDRFALYDNFSLINEDVLKVNLNDLIQQENTQNYTVKIVANLPYYITTPIIMGLFESKVPIESITIMVQKEVADRMQTGPGSKDYGALSLVVQYYADAKVQLNVSASCFMPRPNVDSAVIKLTAHEKPVVDVDETLMFKVIRASFNQRRKTLVNGLKNSSELDYTKEEIVQAIKAIGKEENIRGEKLTLEEFAALSNSLKVVREK